MVLFMDERKCDYWDNQQQYASNYIICPGLCNTCNNYSYKTGSTSGPYYCNTGSTRASAKEACKTKEQYDRCSCYKEKQVNQSINNTSEAGNKNYRRPDYESTTNTKGKTKPSIGGIIVPIIAFLFIVFELIGDFFNSVGTAGYIILPIVIGFTIFRIWREMKFIFHIFNCVWILFMISFCFSEIKNDMANTKLVIFYIIFFLLLILLPTFIRFIFNKIRKKIMEK